MTKTCDTCMHDAVAEIDAKILAGALRREVAAEYGLGIASVKRHARNHLGVGRTMGFVPIRQARGVVAGDPVATFRAAWGLEPMVHQVEYLTETRDTLVLKGRQTGFTQSGAGLCIHVARSVPGVLAAVISPSLRQSTEVTMRARTGLWALGEKMVQDSTSLLRLKNGSRILSLPGTARGVRGYSAEVLIMDEAAWIEEETFVAAMALTAATGGRTIVQSTPSGPVGRFHDLWEAAGPEWARIRVTSEEVPIIDASFLARERRELAPELYAQEYLAEFGEGALQVGIAPFDEERLLSARPPFSDSFLDGWERRQREAGEDA